LTLSTWGAIWHSPRGWRCSPSPACATVSRAVRLWSELRTPH